MTRKIKVAICGLAHDPYDGEIEKKAYEIGSALAKRQSIVFTGATIGYPYCAAKGAYEQGGLSVGISPAENFNEHRDKYHLPTDVFDPIVYTGFGFQGRNVVLVRSSDAVIFIGGGSGTLNEFTTAFRSGKVIGMLKDSGPISESLDSIISICNKSSTNPHVIHTANIDELVEEVWEKTKSEIGVV